MCGQLWEMHSWTLSVSYLKWRWIPACFAFVYSELLTIGNLSYKIKHIKHTKRKCYSDLFFERVLRVLFSVLYSILFVFCTAATITSFPTSLFCPLLSKRFLTYGVLTWNLIFWGDLKESIKFPSISLTQTWCSDVRLIKSTFQSKCDL